MIIDLITHTRTDMQYFNPVIKFVFFYSIFLFSFCPVSPFIMGNTRKDFSYIQDICAKKIISDEKPQNGSGRFFFTGDQDHTTRCTIYSSRRKLPIRG